MPSIPLSQKKMRALVRDLARDQDDYTKVARSHEQAINVLIALAKRGFVGRLRWLVLGR